MKTFTYEKPATPEAAVRDGVNILILSDRDVSPDAAPIPMLMATGAVHHHLIRQTLRTRCGGEPASAVPSVPVAGVVCAEATAGRAMRAASSNGRIMTGTPSSRSTCSRRHGSRRRGMVFRV